MNFSLFYSTLQKSFPFQLTSLQDVFLQKMAIFCTNKESKEIFILKGYAGTGKTTLLSTLVEQLSVIQMKSVLLAPTGRAAKVMSNYSKKPAFTIHKKIYFPKKNPNGGVQFTLQINKHKNTLFIVDEASMISDNFQEVKGMASSSLLEDLLSYVYSGENCKLILIGDTAQLPPVNSELSPALMPETFEWKFQQEIHHMELTEVMRQEEGSGVLENATLIRNQISEAFFEVFQFQIQGYKDIIRLIDGYEILDAIHSAYDKQGMEDTAFIVRSNKRANLYNQQIRSRILFKESDLSVGDFLMVVKNNYFWLDAKEEAGFIANGDIIEVLEIYKRQELYGFQFAQVKVRMLDYPNQIPFETMLLLDTLTSESPSLTYDESNKLYQEVLQDYDNEPMYKRVQKVKLNPYFNALQVKFSYAITCHKAQGGQWNTVFVEQPYLPDGKIDKEYLRWLYTAITRAKEKVYLIGFKDEFFEN
jgi:ATP-dependent exoDNAse (exonuclease V) alpha subunit